MTRMLCSLFAALIFCTLTSGCSLFSSEETEPVQDFESSSLTGTDEIGEASLDTQDELFDETAELADDIPGLDEGFEEGGADQAFTDDPAFNDGFGGETSDQAFNDEFSAEEDDFQEFSDTNENQIDQELAINEFSDLGAESEVGGQAEEAFLEDPIVAEGIAEEFGEPAPTEPVVDVPYTQSTSSNEVTNLEYKAFANGGTVVIDTLEPANYQTIENKDLNQIVIEISNVKLPQRFKRPYITKDFKQDIATINAYANENENSARFVIQLKRPLSPLVQKEGSSILIMTGDSSPLLAADSSENAEPSFSVNSVESSSQEESLVDFAQAQNSTNQLGNSKFSGDPISLEFTNTDVRTIIEVIADRSGVNLIMDEDVEGSTSIRLRQVPWDQALQVTLQSKGLGYVKQGSVLRIAKQSTLSKEAADISDQIKNEKQARLLSGGLKVKYIPVSYANVDKLAGKLKEFLSEAGKITFDDRTSSLVITDYGEYIGRMVELVKALDTPPMQVEISAKLVEAREEFTEEVGINWNLTGGGFNSGSQTGTVSAGLGGPVNSSGLSMDLDVGTFDLFGDLSASLGLFEQQDKIKVLSQPRTVTMNKTKAMIEQVTQVPIQTVVATAGTLPIPNIEYRDLKLSLEVTPQITFNGDVILDVDLKREFAGTEAANGSRELNKRRSKTTVMVKNGKTAVIGGIYQMDDTDVETGIPVLKDIPLLGYLFKQTSTKKSKNELLLFLKPRIIKELNEPIGTPYASPSDNSFDEISVDEGYSDATAPVIDVPESQDFSNDELFEELEGAEGGFETL